MSRLLPYAVRSYTTLHGKGAILAPLKQAPYGLNYHVKFSFSVRNYENSGPAGLFSPPQLFRRGCGAPQKCNSDFVKKRKQGTCGDNRPVEWSSCTLPYASSERKRISRVVINKKRHNRKSGWDTLCGLFSFFSLVFFGCCGSFPEAVYR